MVNRHNIFKNKYFVLTLTVLTVILLLSGCAPVKEKGEKLNIYGSAVKPGSTDTDDIVLNSEDVTIAVMTDNPVGDLINEKYPNAKLFYVNSCTDGITALTNGNADAFIEQRVTYDCAVATGVTGIHLHPDSPLGEPGIVAAGVSEKTKIPDAKALADKFLAEMKETGVLDDMYQRWVVDRNYEMPEIVPAENPSFTMKIGTSGLAEPYTFHIGGTISGYEVELCNRFAAWAGADVEFLEFDWNSIVEACVSGKVDYIFSNLYVTNERSEEMITTDTYMTFDSVIMVRDNEKSGVARLARVEPVTPYK